MDDTLGRAPAYSAMRRARRILANYVMRRRQQRATRRRRKAQTLSLEADQVNSLEWPKEMFSERSSIGSPVSVRG